MVLFGKIPFFIFSIIMLGLIFFSIPSNNRMGMILYDSYRYDEAFQYLKLSEVKKGKRSQNLTAFKKLKDFYLLKGNVPRALELQKKLVETKPKNLEFLIELEKLYGWNIQPENQLATREKRANLLTDEAERTQLLYEIAEGYRWLRDYENTNRIFDIIENKVSREQNFNIINYYLNSKQTNKVIERINKSLEDGSVDLRYIRILSQVYEYDNQIESALETQLLSLKKQYGVKSENSTIDDVLVRIVPSTIENAFPDFERLLMLYIRLEDKESVKKVSRALTKNLDQKYVLMYDLAEVLFDQGYIELAEENYDIIQKRVTRDQKYYLFEIASRYRQMDRPSKAEGLYKRLDKMYPYDVIILESFAEFYEDSGEKRKALNLYYRILQIDNSAARRGVFIQQIGLPIAQADYMKANYLEILNREMKRPLEYKINKSTLRRSKRKVKLRIKRVKLKIINLLEDLGDKEKLLNAYDDLLKDDPNNLSVLKRKAYLLQDQGNYKESEAIFTKIYEQDPQDVDASIVKAQVLLSQRKTDEAIEILEGIKKNSSNWTFVTSMQEEAYFIEDQEKHEALCADIEKLNKKIFRLFF